MKPTSTYMSAILENNSGVQALKTGEYEQARICFRRALNIITEAISLNRPPSRSRPTLHWSENAPLGNDLRTKVKQEKWSTEANLPFVYRRAIFIAPDAEQSYDGGRHFTTTERDYAEESSAIVFNMALSCHLFALNANRSDILERAMKFYEIANNIRQKNCLQMDILDLALLNNVGHAQLEFCNYGVACQCFGMMIHRMQVLHKEGLVCTLSQYDRDGFLLNGLLEQPTIAAAA